MIKQRNIRLVLAYDGTNYAGWQRQKTDKTIQGVIEEAVSTMTQQGCILHGAGRTDAGVHALGMVANFTTTSEIPCPGFIKGINSMIPPDIRVLTAEEASADFHARHHAVSKTYCYRLCIAPMQLPTDRLYCTHVPRDLDLQAINSCAALLLGSHDFSSFEAAGSRAPESGGMGAVRNIMAVNFAQGLRPGMFDFTITGNGFLRHMVRNIVGTLIEAGKNKISVSEFSSIMAAKDRDAAGPTAPAHGLFLQKVHY